MSIELANRVTVSDEVLCQEVNGEMVLLDLNSESYFGLDATGTRIWQLIQETGSLQSAFNAMLSEYEVDPAQLEQDYSEFITALTEAGLISLHSL